MSNQRVDSKGRMYKEDFVAFMGKLKDKKDKSDAYTKKLEEVFGEGVGINFMEKTGVWWMLDYIVDLLVLMFGNDTEDILYWYIYGSNWGVSEDGFIMTFSDLYDILVGGQGAFLMGDVLLILWATVAVVIWKYPTIKNHIRNRDRQRGLDV